MMKKISIQIGEKFQNDYLDLTNKKFVKKWRNIARQNKKTGITEQETIEQFLFEMHQAKLTIDLHHNLVSQEIQEQLKHFKSHLQDLTQNFQQHIAREKVKLPQYLFQRIDRWKAPLNKLKARIQELKNNTSLKS